MSNAINEGRKWDTMTKEKRDDLGEVTVSCVRCIKPFVTPLPVSSLVCPDCRERSSSSQISYKFTIRKDRYDGRIRFEVRKYVYVGSADYDELVDYADTIEEARFILPPGLVRFRGRSLEDPLLVEEWM